MILRRIISTVVFILFIVLGTGCTRGVSFAQQVQPILQKNCQSCHHVGGEGYAVSNFSVESYESVMKGTKFGPVVNPGSSISSTLVVLIEHRADPSLHMPKTSKKTIEEHKRFAQIDEAHATYLPRDQINIIKEWIDQGARNN